MSLCRARERIVEICKRHGIPDNEDSAEKIISQASSTNKLNQKKGDSTRKKLVKAFAFLIVVALASLLPRKSSAMVSGPTPPRIGTYVDETGGAPYKGRRKIAFRSSVQFNPTQRQTNQVLRQSVVTSAQKKHFNSQKPTFLTTERDEKTFDDIYIHGTFDNVKQEITMEGSCGPAHRLEQLRNGLVQTIAKNMGYTVPKVDLDHHLSSRVRQGQHHFTKRKYDPSIVEAISPRIHKLITAQGLKTYELPEGIVSVDCFLNQILSKRIDIFEGSEAQAIMEKEGRFTSEDYTAWSERSSSWNRRFFRLIAEQQGVRDDCVKSILYPKQLYADANGYMETMRGHLRLTALRNTAPNVLEETQALLTKTIHQVSIRVSLLGDFRDSFPGLPGLAGDIKNLVDEYNRLSDLSNDLYRKSRLTCSPLKVPPFGKIVSLDKTILKADEEGYRDQWSLYGATAQRNKSSQEYLKTFNHFILNTNGLVDGPIKASMSESMKKLMNAPLKGQIYDGVDEVFLN